MTRRIEQPKKILAAELIKILKELPLDAEVLVPGKDGLYNVTGVEISFFNTPSNKHIKLLTEMPSYKDEVKASFPGYAWHFNDRVKVKDDGFYLMSRATVVRVDEQYRIGNEYIKLYGVQIDGDDSKTIHWFRAHLLEKVGV